MDKILGDMLRPDRRRLRTNQLVAQIMHVIHPHLCDHDHDHRHVRDATEKLIKMFYDAGAEIVTDAHRAEIGLPPRGPDGWTAAELAALELVRITSITGKLIVPVKLSSEPDQTK